MNFPRYSWSSPAALTRYVFPTLLGALALTACSDSAAGPESPDIPAPTVGELVPVQRGLHIRADNPTVLAGDSTPLRANVAAAKGNGRAADVVWQTLDGGRLVQGVVDSQSVTMFTAAEAGSYRLVGVSPSLGATDTMVVTMASASVTSTITSLVMKPARATILPNDTLRFVVWGRTSTGDSVPAPVKLYPDRGYVRGLDYFCPIEGTFRVRAELNGVEAEAYVTVSKTATSTSGSATGGTSGSIVRIVMSPSRDTIPPGDTLTFQVKGITSTGSTVPVSASLLADRGYVRGLSWIMPLEGTFRIQAIQAGSSLADTAWITVKSGAAPSTGDGATDGSGSTDDGSVALPSDPSNVGTPAPSGEVAEMPRTYLDTRYVAPTGKTINVPAGGDLQAAINNAARGDVIQLAAGARFVGNFYLPAKAGTGWFTIRTGTTLPAEGTRVTPSTASSFAKLVTPNSMPALYTRTSSSASYYRIMGVELSSSASMTYAVVNLGDYNHSAGSASDYPQFIVLDRTYIHGTSSMNLQRCVALNSRSSAVIDSWISDCHYRYLDSQAIGAWDGPGPYKIVNNHLEGASENVMFGGGDPRFSGVVPSDIEIRHNHFYKPLSWKGVGWAIKNLFELKNARRVLVEGNIFENNWAEAQTGFAVVMKTVNQGGGCSWCITADVTWRYNRIINSPGGFNMMGIQNPNGGGGTPARRIVVEHTTFEKVGLLSQAGTQRIFQILGGLTYLTIAHNTAMGESHIILFDGVPTSPPNFVIRDNLFNRGKWGVFGSGVGEGTTALSRFSPGGVFADNAIITAPASLYPSGTYVPSSTTVAGLLSLTSGSFLLSSGTTLYQAGSDGTMVGADVARISSMTSGVR
jgi:plastocyanin